MVDHYDGLRYDCGNGLYMVGKDPAMVALMNSLNLVAASQAKVVIQGETGVGKELVARALHYHSPRRQQPFVAVNCGAIPESLADAMFFGHVKGSFTGAYVNSDGLLAEADKGSLFLDEVNCLPPALQQKLLRAVQEQEYRHVGGTRLIHFDARIISASNKPLEQSVREGSFREDLYYRLHVVPLYVPPLRERQGDIGYIAQFFLERKNEKHILSDEVVNVLKKAYPWPGNIRELENILERAVLGDGPITPETIRTVLVSSSPKRNGVLWMPGITYQEAREAAVGKIEKEILGRALEFGGGRVTEAARLLGLDRSNLNKLLKSRGLR